MKGCGCPGRKGHGQNPASVGRRHQEKQWPGRALREGALLGKEKGVKVLTSMQTVMDG